MSGSLQNMVGRPASVTMACWRVQWRPENLQAYGDPDLADLAAAYAFGLAKNHPFIDGNKRT